MFVMVPRNCILDLILLTLRMNSFKMITISSMSLSSRDKDGYYWLTGRVDDVINVRLVSDSPSYFYDIMNKSFSSYKCICLWYKI